MEALSSATEVSPYVVAKYMVLYPGSVVVAPLGVGTKGRKDVSPFMKDVFDGDSKAMSNVSPDPEMEKFIVPGYAI